MRKLLIGLKVQIRRLDPRGRSQDFQKSVRNAAYSSVDYLVLPVLWLVATPVFVSRLGVDGYGIWALANTFMGLNGVFAFGLSDATIRYVSKYRALNDEGGVVRVIRSTLTMYVVLATLAASVAFVSAPFLAGVVFKVAQENTDLAVVALRVAGFGIVARFVDSVFRSAVHGFERYDIPARVSMLTNTATIIINVFLLLAGCGLITVLLISVLTLTVAALVNAILLKRLLLPRLNIVPLLDREALREIFSYGLYSWSQGLTSMLQSQLDRLLIATLLGTSALAYYTICLQLAQQIHTFPARLMSFLFPLASRLNEQGGSNQLRRLYFRGSGAVTVLAVSIGLPLFLLSHSILTVWMGPNFANDAAGVLRVLAFTFTLFATGIVPYYYMNGTGFVRLNAFLGLMNGIAVATFVVILVPSLGVVGAAWSRATNVPTSVIARTVLHYRLLEDRRWYAGFVIFVPVLVSFALGYIVLAAYGEPHLSLLPLLGTAALLSCLGCSLAALATWPLFFRRSPVAA